MKQIFLTDLDGTCIYSDKYDFSCDKIEVDRKGTYVGYMNKSLYDNLMFYDKEVPFIPITTRSLEEYKRIQLPINPKYALIYNGAMLLKDGLVDTKWLDKTEQLIEKHKSKMNEILAFIKANFLFDSLDLRGNFFIFVKSDYCSDIKNKLFEEFDLSDFYVYTKGKKLYVLPKELDKSNGLLRIKEYLDCKYVMSAGDSDIDKNMLNMADVVIDCDTLRNEGNYIGYKIC